jgi:hypothetical protein
MLNALRGYFTIQLPDGTQVPCLLNMYAVEQWTTANKKTLSDLDHELRENLLAAIPGLAWSGVCTHYLLHEEEPPMTEQKFRILLGSADWTGLAENVAKALSLEESTGAPKKKGNRASP